MVCSITRSSKFVSTVVLLALWCATLLTPIPILAATGFVQECTNGTGAGGATITCTFGSSVTAGNLIACADWIHSTTDTVTLSDTASNTYNVNPTYVQDATAVFRGIGHYAKNVTGSFTVITATWGTGGVWRGIVCHEISGADHTSPTDGAVGNNLSAGATTDANTSTAITTTANGDYLFGATWDTSLGCDAQSAGTGYTGHTLTGCVGYSETEIQSSAGSVAATFTPASGSDRYITFIQAFKAAASSGSRRSSMMLMGVQ